MSTSNESFMPLPITVRHHRTQIVKSRGGLLNQAIPYTMRHIDDGSRGAWNNFIKSLKNKVNADRK